MTQTMFPVLVFVVLLAFAPFALRAWQKRFQGRSSHAGQNVKLVSAVAVGSQQRVVTVEVGPAQARTWLVLGVTPQQVTCLHTMPAGALANPPEDGRAM